MAAANDTTAPAEHKASPMLPSNMLGSEFARNVWCCTVENTVTIADLAVSSFYASVANKLRIGDHLEVMPENGDWFAHLIVRNVDRGTAKTGLITCTKFDDAAIPSESYGDVEIRWRGPKNRFGVVRKSDGHVLKENLGTKVEAMAWAVEHERSFAA